MIEKELIDKYLGIPYKHLGRTHEGLDCWGLIKCVYHDIGIEVIDLENYDKNWSYQGGNLFIDNYYEKWAEHASPAFLDVILFKNSKGIPYHAGLYLSKGWFLHSCTAGVVRSRSTDKMWEKRLSGIFRYKEGINGHD